MGGFADEISELIVDEAFENIALQSLIEIFGENNTQSLIFHIGGRAVLKDPALFERKIRAVFKDGADLIFKHIKYNALRYVQLNRRDGSKPKINF